MMRWIYISPHLDDAVLSAGGLIYDQARSGMDVEIWTIVCGFPPPGELTPLAQILHMEWGTGTVEDTVKLRRSEDKRAASIVGAKSVYFDVPDCIYRRGQDGEPLYPDIFVHPHQAEADLPTEIADMLLEHLQPDDQLVCVLGIGGHVDHILVRQGVERLERPLKYLADIPYLFKHPEELAGYTNGMKKSVQVITEAGLRSWIEAVLAYKSQMSSLFDNLEEVERSIRLYHQDWGGLAVWELK